MIDRVAEMEFLEQVTETYVTSESPQDRAIKTMAIRAFKPYMNGRGDVLEFGCCDGFMSSLIAPLCNTLTVADGSTTFIEIAKKRVSGRHVEFVHTLFEDYRPEKRFDYIFATYVLEHVQDAVGFLRMAGQLLKPEGLLFLVVPNAKALSRQLARHMGLLPDLYALTPNDVNHGHRRVYDRQTLTRDIEAADLSQVGQGGLMLKLLADFQMDKMIDTGILGEPQLDGLYRMGLEYPDFAGSLFSVCKR
jgi:2-polyprenyl-3-methyl-5-hydroxy-6-metoxy-1,4-benzoquinol methylase